MNQQEIYQFVLTFFQAYDAPILEKRPDFLKVKLPVELDKALTNRPFYWNYVETMGITPETMTLSLAFSDDQEAADPSLRIENITFGCKRLEQIMDVAIKHGRFVRLFETLENPPWHPARAYVPWLCLNYKAEFICDRKKDLFYDIGFNLHSGELTTRFFDVLAARRFSPAIPSRAYKLEPSIPIEEAISRVERYLIDEIEKMDTDWAVEARQRLNEEIARIQHYYRAGETKAEEAENSESADEMQKRIEEARSQYLPHIRLTLGNAGLFFLTPQSSFNLPLRL